MSRPPAGRPPGLLLVWRRVKSFFVWLMIVVNLMSGGGYLMIDPIAKFGDWGAFLEGLEPNVVWRVGLILSGVAVSLFAVFWGRRTITTFAPSARLLCWGPYFVGGIVFAASAAFNPLGPKFIVTVALATFGGTAWLAWFLPFLVSKDHATGAPVARANGWLAAGAAAALFTVAVLGPGVRF